MLCRVPQVSIVTCESTTPPRLLNEIRIERALSKVVSIEPRKPLFDLRSDRVVILAQAVGNLQHHRRRRGQRL